MKIIKCGNDEGVVFGNGNSLYDYHIADCCENNYADWEQLEESALSYDFDEDSFKIVPNDYGFRFGDKSRTFFVPCYTIQNGYYSSDVTIVYCDKDDKIINEENIECSYVDW